MKTQSIKTRANKEALKVIVGIMVLYVMSIMSIIIF